MKKTLLKSAILMFIVFLASCGKDDPQPVVPTLTATSTQIVNETFNGVYYSGVIVPSLAILSVDFSGTTPNGFLKLVISKIENGTPEVIETIGKANVQLNGNVFNYKYNYNVEETDINQDVELKAEVMDEKNLSTTITIANLNVKRATRLFELTMEADGIANDIANKEYYLLLKPDNESAAAIVGEPAHVSFREELEISKLYSRVQLIFDYTPGLSAGPTTGPYFGSPVAVASVNTKLTEGFTVKNSTLVKIAEYSSLSNADAQKLQNVATGNPHDFHELFDRLPASPNAELVYLNKPSKYFIMFKLADGRVGYMANIAYNQDKIRVGFDLWISSK